MFNAMMEAFMEEVVGFVFHLEVEVDQNPQVGVVTGADGGPRSRSPPPPTARQDRMVQAAGRVRARPDGPGWRSTFLDDDDVSEDELEEIVSSCRRRRGPRSAPRVWATQRGRALAYSAPDEDGSVKTVGQSKTKTDDPTPGSGATHVSVRLGKKFKCVTGGPASSDVARVSSTVSEVLDLHECLSVASRAHRGGRVSAMVLVGGVGACSGPDVT